MGKVGLTDSGKHPPAILSIVREREMRSESQTLAENNSHFLIVSPPENANLGFPPSKRQRIDA